MFVGLASVPEREKSLKDTINSLYHQVNHIYVGLNSYRVIPRWLNMPKVTTVLLDNERGDAAKFYFIDKIDGVFLSCDDDIIYPKNYVWNLTNNLEGIHTFHGRNFSKFPIKSYYNSANERYYCLHDSHSSYVQFGGTGVMAFNTKDFKVKYEDFIHPNMADVFVGNLAKQQNVKIKVLSHEKGWIKANPKMRSRTIYDNYHHNDNIQTTLVNEVWNNNS